MLHGLYGFCYLFLQMGTKGIINLHIVLGMGEGHAGSFFPKMSLPSEHTCVFIPEAWAGAEHPKDTFNVSPILRG